MNRAPLILVFLLVFMTAPGLSAAPPLESPRVVMLGDSLTAGCDWAGHLPQAIVENQGISGDSTAQILARLDRVIEARPDLVFIQAGINDLGRLEKETIIIENHRAIWNRLRSALPGARLHLVSLLPVSQRRYPGWDLKIREINLMLETEARRRGQVFIDLYQPLADENGHLRPEFSSDGLHLSPAGYEVWLATIKPYIVGGGQ